MVFLLLKKENFRYLFDQYLPYIALGFGENILPSTFINNTGLVYTGKFSGQKSYGGLYPLSSPGAVDRTAKEVDPH